MSNRKMTICLLAGKSVRLRFDRANARHLENAKRFRDALLITVEYRNIKAKDDIEGNAKRFRDALLITVE